MSIAAPSEDIGVVTTLVPRRRAEFVQTKTVEAISKRALAYLKAGFSIHFRGPRQGKTSLALHAAALLNRPTLMITGDEEWRPRRWSAPVWLPYRKVVDRFIHTVTRWRKPPTGVGRTTGSPRHAARATPSSTTSLRARGRGRQRSPQRARGRCRCSPRRNRMSRTSRCIRISASFSPATRRNMPASTTPRMRSATASHHRCRACRPRAEDRRRCGALRPSAGKVAPVVDLVREFRETGEYDQTPTLRASIVICRMMAQEKFRPSSDDPHFVEVCLDILGSKSLFAGKMESKRTAAKDAAELDRAPLSKACGSGRPRRAADTNGAHRQHRDRRAGNGRHRMTDNRANNTRKAGGGLRKIATLQALATGAKPRQRHELANRFGGSSRAPPPRARAWHVGKLQARRRDQIGQGQRGARDLAAGPLQAGEEEWRVPSGTRAAPHAGRDASAGIHRAAQPGDDPRILNGRRPSSHAAHPRTRSIQGEVQWRRRAQCGPAGRRKGWTRARRPLSRPRRRRGPARQAGRGRDETRRAPGRVHGQRPGREGAGRVWIQHPHGHRR